MTHLGTVSALWRYPVKAMLGEQLNASLVTSAGLAGDRGYALIDGDGRICTPKIIRKWGPVFRSRSRYLEEPDGETPALAEITLPDGQRLLTSDQDAEARLSELVGFAARLITEAPTPLKLESQPVGAVPSSEEDPTVDYPVINRFFDLGSLHLLTTATLAKLRALSPGTTFDARRFRPNLVITPPNGEVGFLENDWTGKTLAIGADLRIRILMPTVRCVVTTRSQDDLPDDMDVLRTAVTHNKANVGVYAMVEQGGRVRRGDAVEFLG
ncbi:MAG: MOSC N-terminal beta barrel domain-containing protein [Dehalococcoidia bacterium]